MIAKIKNLYQKGLTKLDQWSLKHPKIGNVLHIALPLCLRKNFENKVVYPYASLPELSKLKPEVCDGNQSEVLIRQTGVQVSYALLQKQFTGTGSTSLALSPLSVILDDDKYINRIMFEDGLKFNLQNYLVLLASALPLVFSAINKPIAETWKNAIPVSIPPLATLATIKAIKLKRAENAIAQSIQSLIAPPECMPMQYSN
jgi:hypothetical protein